ncbi:MAG: hypothetical protein QNK11_05795 [Legionella sp.]|nr:hypothetical protein [Legionella sp.]
MALFPEDYRPLPYDSNENHSPQHNKKDYLDGSEAEQYAEQLVIWINRSRHTFSEQRENDRQLNLLLKHEDGYIFSKYTFKLAVSVVGLVVTTACLFELALIAAALLVTHLLISLAAFIMLSSIVTVYSDEGLCTIKELTEINREKLIENIGIENPTDEKLEGLMQSYMISLAGVCLVIGLCLSPSVFAATVATYLLLSGAIEAQKYFGNNAHESLKIYDLKSRITPPLMFKPADKAHGSLDDVDNTCCL